MKRKLGRQFYKGSDTLHIARTLLGKVLCTSSDGIFTSGIITETEAYLGETDRASHAYGGRYTTRTSVMFSEGGVAYVYLCYGIHALFNVVTHRQGIPHAILIRGIEPVEGVSHMIRRRGLARVTSSAFSGPGKVTQSLGITLSGNGVSLSSNSIWIEDRGIVFPEEKIRTTPRIGVDYAGEDALLPYRFVAEANGLK